LIKSFENIADLEWEELDIDVVVDSGQAGIFDLEHYFDDSVIEEEPKFDCDHNKWYRACCEQTLTKMSAGIISFGVVSSSGYGDGSYIVNIIKNNDGKIIAIKIDFCLGDDEESNE
jgi:hypothetical protein